MRSMRSTMENRVQIEPLAIPDVLLITPRVHRDDRGAFAETFSAKAFAAAGLPTGFVQDNHSLSVQKGVVRGLHYQIAPAAQAKLVRVVRGAVLDVAVDIRRSSPTFGSHVSALLTADNWRQMFVPIGFAHGYAVLEPNTEVIYKVTDLYAPQQERGILWNDPTLSIDWGVLPSEAILAARDLKLPKLAEATDLF